MDEIESLLGDDPRRFDDWVDGGSFVSRLTVVRNDGVPQTYEARAVDHATARRQACALAVSATRAPPPGAAPIPLLPFAPPPSTPPMPPPWTQDPPAAVQGMGGGAGSAAPVPIDSGPPPPIMHSQNMRMPFASGMTPMPAHIASRLGMYGQGQQPPRPPQPGQPPQDSKQPQRYPFRKPMANGSNGVGAGGTPTPRFHIDRAPSRGGLLTQRHKLPAWVTGGNRLSVGYGGGANDKRPLHARPSGHEVDDFSPASKKRNVNVLAPSLSARLGSKEVDVKKSIPLPVRAAEVEEDDDEDDDEDNYLTNFNELCQRGVAGLRVPKYNYVQLSTAFKVPRWECTATTAATPPGGGEPVTLSKVVMGKNKKDSRRIAAKELLTELVNLKIVTQATVDTKGAYVPCSGRSQMASSSANKMSPKMMGDIAAAVSILNQLWQKEKFECKPKWSTFPVSSGATGRWKCTLLIKTKQFGEVEVESTSPQKKFAKQLTAFEAVKKLKELKIPGIDQINVHAKPQNNIVTVAPKELNCDGASPNASVRTLDEATRQRLDNEVQGDGEVDAHAGPNGAKSGFGALFVVSPEVNTVIARSALDVSQWVADHVMDGTILGVYFDSRPVRKEFETDAKQAGRDVESLAFTSPECRAIAVCTGSSILLVAAHLVGDPRPFRSSSAGSGLKSEDVAKEEDNAQDNSAQIMPPLAPGRSKLPGTPWIPKSLKFLLERSECAKFGVELDGGRMALRSCYGIECLGLNDLSTFSLAVKGVSDIKKGISHTAVELVSDWLNQRLSPFAEDCVNSVDALSDVLASTEDVIAPAVSVAFACSMIQSRVAEDCEKRRRKGVTYGEDYMELCNRLSNRLSLLKSQHNQYVALPM